MKFLKFILCIWKIRWLLETDDDIAARQMDACFTMAYPRSDIYDLLATSNTTGDSDCVKAESS